MSNFVSIDTHDLVSSKENIQPLRRGRDTTILCAALQAETDIDIQQELERQRNEFEIQLRNNAKEDPLSDWCSYVHWIEQSFPKQAKEGKLNVVLQKCLNKFKDFKQYANDIRFVKLCIKYAELEENTVELLGQIHGHGIGVSCAEMYIAWAEKYAVDNCFKKANAIYERGLQCSAQPIQLLQDAYQHFQAFLVRKMLNERETFQPTFLDSNPTEIRQPYNVLQSIASGQKEVVPGVRIGTNVIGSAGKFEKVGQKEQKPKSNTMLKIFEDPEDNFISTEPKAKIEKVPSRKTLTKENTVKPGTWNNKKNKNVPFKVEPSNLPFQVHRDDNDEKEIKKKDKSVPSVLKSIKTTAIYEDDNFASAPLFYPEPYDPTKFSMYCKEQVYAGGIEFQFEELRAIQYKRKRQQELILKTSKVPKAIESISVASQQTHSQPLKTKIESHSKTKNDKAKSKVTETNDKKEKNRNEPRRKNLISNPAPNTVPEENLASTDYSLNQTIHTKEALSEMQQLWFSKPASPVPVFAKPNKPAAKSILKSSKPCFSFYVDESCLENFKSSDEDKPLDLTFKLGNLSEEDGGAENVGQSTASKLCKTEALGGVRKKIGITNTIKQSTNDKENCFFKENFDPIKVLPELKIDDDDKENGIPDNYCGPIGKSNRKVSGILTPAENIEIAQLSDEEIEIDEEEEEVQPQDYSSLIQWNNTAVTETWNFTKGFQFPRGESTPNIRKSICEKIDCDNSMLLPELKSTNVERLTTGDRVESDGEIKSTSARHISDKKLNSEADNFNKNLSVIAETSREYRSSSSASSGASTLALRSSKNLPHTPSDIRNSKQSLTTSHTILLKTKLQNYTGYEASSESSNIASKTPMEIKADLAITTFNLMEKLNAIESGSITENSNEDKMEDINSEMNKLKIQQTKESAEIETSEKIDPFCEKTINRLLQEVDFPKPSHSNGYFLLHDINLPAPKVGLSVALGVYNYDVKKLLGEGSYAKVFKLLNTETGETKIAKYQTPAFPWEFYIAREILSRIQDKDLITIFMNVEEGYFFKNCSILLTHPVEYGDLLTVINKMKQEKMLCQILAMHFTCQILKILETLHSCKIIHGDIKPDNFLLRNQNGKLHLQLIDFGRSIDMSLFPEGTTFTRIVTTEGFTTIEMKLGKPWTFQIDFYGAANCGHCLLYGDYMKVVERDGVWNISKIIPRYWARSEWKTFFTSLLNVKSCSKLPDLSELRKSFETILTESSEIEFSLFKLNNLLNNR